MPDRDAETGAETENQIETDTEVAARLRLIVSRLARQLRQHAAGGLTPSQVSALTTIDVKGPLRLGELAGFEAVAPPTITRVVAALVDAGLVERRGDPDDARSALVAVTDLGRDAMREVRQERTALLVSRLARLDAEQRAALSDAVNLLEVLARVETR